MAGINWLLCGLTSLNSSFATCFNVLRASSIFSVSSPGICTRMRSAPSGVMTGSLTPN